MNPQVLKDGVRHVAIEIACYGLAVDATCSEQLGISSERIGDTVFIAEACFAAIPAAINAHAAFDRHLLAGDIFRFMDDKDTRRVLRPLSRRA